MPFINTKYNRPLSAEKEEAIKTKLGKAIELIGGKTEQWLMLGFEENCRLWFRGENDVPMAMVEIQIFGQASESDCERMTARVCEILSEELGITPDRVYVNYTFSTCWGWNGGNF